MDGLKSYLMAVCCGAILCAILKQIVGNNGMSGGLLRTLSGLFIAICVIAPWKELSLDSLEVYNPLPYNERNAYVEAGTEISQQKIAAIISKQTQAYILEKARQMQLQVEVRVELSEEFIPIRAEIKGNCDLMQKEELSAFIAQHIGIKKEMQRWN